MEEEKRLEIILTKVFASWEIFSRLNQETIDSINKIGEIIKGIKQNYSDGTASSYLLIKPNGTYPQDFKVNVCCKLPYNF